MSPDPRPQTHVTITQHADALVEGAQQIGVQADKVEGDLLSVGNVAAGATVNVGRHTYITQIVHGLGDMLTHWDGSVRNFFNLYVGSDEKPAPFGGRRDDLQRLDVWLNDAQALRSAFLAAPAGRGKSALLAHWVVDLQARKDAHIIFFPISIRFNTNREEVVFAALAARIAKLFGETVGRADSAQQYRGIFNDYLSRPSKNGKPVLVILDALDEAAGWQAGADLFPSPLPTHVRALVSARTDASNTPKWLAQLGWEREAQVWSLDGLSVEGVREALASMGNPLDALAPRDALVARLHELSEGDPLMVRLYVEALLPKGAQLATLQPDDLRTLQPGLKPFMDRWFEEQKKLWASEPRANASAAARDKAVNALLNVCALALGPLARDDVHELAADELPSASELEWASEALNRFVLGDGTTENGYVFAHPRLGNYFAERLGAREKQTWQARFLRYGRETLHALRDGALPPQDAPPYAVRFYGAHLDEAGAPNGEVYDLLCEGWLRAREKIEGTLDGFLSDSERVWSRAEKAGGAALGQMVRAALCHASVASLGANIKTELLVACVKAGVMSLSLALVLARAKPTAEEQAEALAELSELAGEQRAALLAQAFSVAQAITDEDNHAEALSAIAERLLADQQPTVLAQALAAAQAISNEAIRAYALSAIAARLPPEQPHLLAQALAAAQAITAEEYRAEALSAIATRLPAEQQPAVFAQALAAAQAIRNENHRADALSTIATRLPAEQQPAVFAQALAATQAITDEDDHARALSAVAARLPADQSHLLAQALAAAQAITDDYHRADALSVVAARLPANQPHLLAKALALAQKTATQAESAEALAHLAAHWQAISHFNGQSELSLLVQTLRAFSRSQRSVCLQAIAALTPVIARLGGERALQGVVQAITDTAEWWP